MRTNKHTEALLRVENLTIDYWNQGTWFNVVNHLSFTIHSGEILGLAGESGCGKSSTAYALLGYRKPGSRLREGAVYLRGQDLFSMEEAQLQQVRGNQIGIVLQNPATSLSPSMRVGRQISETLRAHKAREGRNNAQQRSQHLLSEVRLTNPAFISTRYPHQLSGGQKQRVAIAMALACNPALLVLDEPTTGLDVTTEAHIVQLLARLQDEHGTAMFYVTHDMALLAQICDRVAIMYAGELVEIASVEDIFRKPLHPYTRGLIAAVPSMTVPPDNSQRLRGQLRRGELPLGCRFSPRCDYARQDCFSTRPPLDWTTPDHGVACPLWETVGERYGCQSRSDD